MSESFYNSNFEKLFRRSLSTPTSGCGESASQLEKMDANQLNKLFQLSREKKQAKEKSKSDKEKDKTNSNDALPKSTPTSLTRNNTNPSQVSAIPSNKYSVLGEFGNHSI